jgi:hypothetical protein
MVASGIARYSELKSRCRFIHIDASHQFASTLHELAIADQLIAEDGLVALDDFTNLDYSQNIAAIYKYLYTTRTKLTPILVTNEKAYLCRRNAFSYYGNFVLHHAVAEMADRMIDAALARTDRHPEYRAFYLRIAGPSDSKGF